MDIYLDNLRRAFYRNYKVVHWPGLNRNSTHIFQDINNTYACFPAICLNSLILLALKKNTFVKYQGRKKWW